MKVVATGLGGHGVLARVSGPDDGPTILLRADLDALPLRKGGPKAGDDPEDPTHAHHACGHDGHMAMVAGTLAKLQADGRSPATVYGLFQPAEETGQGARRVLDDDAFDVAPDHVFAIHNLPGVPLGTISCRQGPMACASTGLELRFRGSTAHAAHPEAGHNPIPAIAQLVPKVLATADHLDDAWGLVTPIHMRAGKIAYGTAAGHGSLRFTLRADADHALERMCSEALKAARGIADDHGLRLEHQLVEPFPATDNDPDAYACVKHAAQAADLKFHEAEAPQRWSEDFGHFTSKWPGALIGLGSGTDQPELHTPDYEFPDDLLEPGIRFWTALIHETCT